MKKLAVVFSTVLALAACNKTPDPAVSVNPATVEVAYSGTDGTVAVELKANRAWKLTRDEQTWYSVEPLEGTGDATLYIRVDALEEVAIRAAELTIVAETATAKLSIVQGLPEVEDVKSGSFVIEEVFFTGCLLEDGQTTDSMDGDQYFKITNNTDKLLYADGLIICKSSENSQNGGFSYWLIDNDLSGHILVKDMFQFPGDGDDVPVLPGRSLVIALAAQDFATENGYGLDLSEADFEIFDGEELDVDNPDVPNMNIFLLCPGEASGNGYGGVLRGRQRLHRHPFLLDGRRGSRGGKRLSRRQLPDSERLGGGRHQLRRGRGVWQPRLQRHHRRRLYRLRQGGQRPGPLWQERPPQERR